MVAYICIIYIIITWLPYTLYLYLQSNNNNNMTYLIIILFVLIAGLIVIATLYVKEAIRTSIIIDSRNDIIYQLNDTIDTFDNDLKGTFNKN